MRLFFLGAGIVAAAIGSAAPRYHAVALGVVPVSDGSRRVSGFANDGSIALSGNSPQLAYRYYNGKYETFESITGGYSPSALVRISSKDAFSFNDAGAVSFYNGQARQVYGTAPSYRSLASQTRPKTASFATSSLSLRSLTTGQLATTNEMENGKRSNSRVSMLQRL